MEEESESMKSITSVARLMLGLAVPLMSLGAFQAAPNQILQYKFEEAAGNTAADSSGNGLNGTWSGLTNLISASAVGDCSPNTPGNTRSIVFAVPATVRTVGGYVSRPNTAATRFTGPFTMMVWMKPTTLVAGQNHVDMSGVIFNADYLAASGWNGYTMHRTIGGNIRFTIGDATASNNLQSTGTAPDNVWTHVACVYTGTQKIIYLNGVANTTLASTLNPGVWNFANLRIGLDDYDRNYYGNLDEVRLFNVALTAQEVNAYYVGVPAPTGLTATAGINQVALSWTAAAGAVSYNIYRSGSSGAYSGPPLATVTAPTTNYTDNTAANPNTYFYVVRTVIGGVESPNSNEVNSSPLPAEVTATPNTGLQTNENGATTQFTIRFNQPAPAGGSTVTIVSNDPGEGSVSSPLGTSFTVAAGTSPTIVVTVTGVDDSVADGAVPYTVTVTASGFPGLTIPPVQVTNNDNDVAGITFTRISGITTSEGAGTDTFSVELNTQPVGFVDLPLSSSNTAEGTVSPATLRFTPSGNPTYNPATGVGDWNVPHVVTVTGVDDTVLDFAVAFTIVTGPLQPSNPADTAGYSFDPVDISAVNLDDEPIPALPTVWGGGGGGGGCGLLGLEAALLAGLAALRRRRNR
jgi:hypothetical protein